MKTRGYNGHAMAPSFTGTKDFRPPSLMSVEPTRSREDFLGHIRGRASYRGGARGGRGGVRGGRGREEQSSNSIGRGSVPYSNIKNTYPPASSYVDNSTDIVQYPSPAPYLPNFKRSQQREYPYDQQQASSEEYPYTRKKLRNVQKNTYPPQPTQGRAPPPTFNRGERGW